MNKRIRFYGMTIEFELQEMEYKKVAKYIRKKRDENTFYIQRKRDGSYIFYYEAQAEDGVRTGYYACEFSFDEMD